MKTIKLTRKNRRHLQHSSSTGILLIGICILLMWLTACATLQHQKGYENYPRNEFWRTKS